MKVFKDYTAAEVKLDDEAAEHIADKHPEITSQQIAETLADPDEVRKSHHKEETSLFYKKRINERGQTRFTAVIVKSRLDGNWIDSAMTTSKVKEGELIYQKTKESLG